MAKHNETRRQRKACRLARHWRKVKRAREQRRQDRGQRDPVYNANRQGRELIWLDTEGSNTCE